MSDITIKAVLIQSVAEVLAPIDTLTGLTPKGGYAFGKQVDAVGPANARYQKAKFARLNELAKKDTTGKPITQTVGNVVMFDFGEGFGVTPEHVGQAIAELNDEDITLPGARMVLVSELGTAKLTPAQSRVLIAAKMLEDKEPE